MEKGKNISESARHSEPGKRLGWIMALYLLGLFIGALSTGIITPARTIIQSGLGVDSQTGIWMITIYTLFYAAVIPISGKLADRCGRKIVYVVSIGLFGAGSVLCGLSSSADSFALLMAGRVVQALGAGGIMPIATAEFGTSFPEEKRGMALGLVGGVFGIANVLGATAGSAILDVFGASQWQWIFYLNVPFCLIIIVLSLFFIPNSKGSAAEPIDKLGTLVMTLLIISLLYGMKNIDYFNFADTVLSVKVYPFLIAAVVLIPVFVYIEKRAKDPIFHMEYMSNRQIVLTLLMALLAGAGMMGMIFIPQFAENALGISTGAGGYFVLILGFFAGAASPVSGVIIDKIGAKPVLGAGFFISVVGCLYLAFVAAVYSNLLNVVISLVLIGLGMGLTMGTPLNYMMLSSTRDEDSNSALATLSLVRSIGTSIAPAIMVGFLIQAGTAVSANLMESMPALPEAPALTQTARLNEIMGELKGANEETDAMLEQMDFDSMMSMDMPMDSMSGDLTLPAELLDSLQSADVTNITERTKEMASYMFESATPDVIVQIQAGIGSGIDGIAKGIDGIDAGLAQMSSGVGELRQGMDELSQGIAGVSAGVSGMETALSRQDAAIAQIEQTLTTADEADAAQLSAQLEQLKAARASLAAKLDASNAQLAQMQAAYEGMASGKSQLEGAIQQATYQRGLMAEAEQLMTDMQADIPGLFDTMKTEYLASIDAQASDIESSFQATMNDGFHNMYICVGAFNILALILLAFYRDKKTGRKAEAELPAQSAD